MHIDVFKDDAFTMSSLTALIALQPHQPSRITQLGYFNETGVPTTTVLIERTLGGLALVGNQPRGGTVQNVNAEKRDVTPFVVPHLPQNATIYADEIQNLRAAGEESNAETMSTYVAQRLATMRRRLDATMEYHRISALQGKVLDANGTTVITDLFTAFNITQQTLAMDLDNDATDVRARAIQATRLSEDALGGVGVASYRAFCSDSFFDALISHPKVEVAYERWNQGEFLRSDPRAGFLFANIIWENYRGAVNGVKFIADDHAILVPEGVIDLNVCNFAPADTMSAANTMGLPYYAQQEVLRMDKGVELEAQTNPANLCTRPDAIIRLGLGGTVTANMMGIEETLDAMADQDAGKGKVAPAKKGGK